MELFVRIVWKEKYSMPPKNTFYTTRYRTSCVILKITIETPIIMR